MIQEKRIFCKVHDNGEIVIKVGIDQPNGVREVYPVETVWNDLSYGRFNFYTFENGRKAKVEARVSRSGRKYLTTHPDWITENNLDELRSCPI